jgi:PTH1 family peptidyl-tRNA hydrolase
VFPIFAVEYDFTLEIQYLVRARLLNLIMFDWIVRFFKPETKELDPMKYLIVGLGNMGPDYDETRHNVGFEVVDALAKEFNVEFKDDSLGDIAEFKYKGRTFVLLKPSTYMNLSGKSVRYWLQKKKVPIENLLVVLDDLNLPFEKQRLRAKGKDGGHNGLKNIDQLNGGNNYARLRIGIGDDFSKGRQVDYVLGKWSDKEREKLPEIINYAVETIKGFGTIGVERAMNEFNTKGANQQ